MRILSINNSNPYSKTITFNSKKRAVKKNNALSQPGLDTLKKSEEEIQKSYFSNYSYIKRNKNKKLTKSIFSDGFLYDFNTRNDDRVNKRFLYDIKTRYNNWGRGEDVELSKYVDYNLSLIELRTTNFKKTSFVRFCATRVPDDMGGCEYTTILNNKKKNISVLWTYPKMNFKFKGSKEEAEILKNALQNIKDIISSSEYEEDYGNTKSLNSQLDKVINYLSEYKKGDDDENFES